MWEHHFSASERMPMVRKDIVLGVMKFTSVAEASDTPGTPWFARLHDLVVAHVSEGQELWSMESLSRSRQTKHV